MLETGATPPMNMLPGVYNPYNVLQQTTATDSANRNVGPLFSGTPPAHKKARKPRPSQMKTWRTSIIKGSGIERMEDVNNGSYKRTREELVEAAEDFCDAKDTTSSDSVAPSLVPAVGPEPMQMEPSVSPPAANEGAAKAQTACPPKVLRWLPYGFVEAFVLLAGVMRPTVRCEMVLGSDEPPPPKGRRKGRSPRAEIALTPAREHVGKLYAQLHDHKRND